MIMAKPKFKSDIDIETVTKVKKIIDEKFAEIEDIKRKEIEDIKRKETINTIESKVAALKRSAQTQPQISSSTQPPVIVSHEHDHEHEEVGDCPTCKKHKLKIQNKIAKCTGENCGKEYLLLERPNLTDSTDIKKLRKDYFCINCGFGVTKDEVDNHKIDSCPLCGTDKGVLSYDWNSVDNAKLKKRR